MAKGDDANDAVRAHGMGVNPKLDLKELDSAQTAIAATAAAIKSLEDSLRKFSQNSYTIANSINQHLKSIGDQATTTANQLAGVSAAVGAAGKGGPSVTPAASSAAGGTGGVFSKASTWVSGATSSASSAISSVMNHNIVGGLSMGTFLGQSDSFAADLALAPLRYMRQRINTNRDTALMASGGLNMQAMQQGTNTSSIMTSLSKFPGNIYGTPQDLIGAFGAAPALGASYGFGGAQGVRAKGFFAGLQQMQTMTPMTPVGGAGGLVDTLGGYAANTGSQQKSMMLTGGAMGIIGAGGRQKSLSEWAESILRWFEGLRGGPMRSKPFNHGDLMAQYFPGSNIDAWFEVNGVPQGMRDYWWTYALSKAKTTGGTGGAQFTIGADENNVAWQRLRSGSELTRTEFGLAGQMSNQYARREGSNRWFNQMIGQFQQSVIPAISNSMLGWIQMLPDSIEDLLMTGAERGAGALLGDVGDVGIGDSYGATGGTGLSGLHPDMKSKVGRMMRANPALRMNSGLRDTGLQRKLRAGGNANVSGGPSAHTRGMAADLGPSSQYGWIAKNAARFGLASGKGHGEPWHVGMKGDIPGIGDPYEFNFDSFLDTLKGFGSDPGSLIEKIFGKLTGALSGLLGGSANSKYNTGTADTVFDSLKSGGGVATMFNPKAAFETAANSIGQNARGSVYGQYIAGDDVMRDIHSTDDVTRGKAVAKVLAAAGFQGQDLKNMMRISYRESHWTPDVWNSGPKDESGGLFQANQKPWLDIGKTPPFTRADVYDPLAAAYIAHDQFTKRSDLGMGSPGGPYSPWNINGNWTNGIPPEAASLTEQAYKAAGLGDIEAMRAATNLIPLQNRGGGITFNNEFKIDGGGGSSYGGGGGGIDVRRTVTQIADHLEDEMKRRLARAS